MENLATFALRQMVDYTVPFSQHAWRFFVFKKVLAIYKSAFSTTVVEKGKIEVQMNMKHNVSSAELYNSNKTLYKKTKNPKVTLLSTVPM